MLRVGDTTSSSQRGKSKRRIKECYDDDDIAAVNEERACSSSALALRLALKVRSKLDLLLVNQSVPALPILLKNTRGIKASAGKTQGEGWLS
jgi:hypothetical protein